MLVKFAAVILFTPLFFVPGVLVGALGGWCGVRFYTCSLPLLDAEKTHPANLHSRAARCQARDEQHPGSFFLTDAASLFICRYQRRRFLASTPNLILLSEPTTDTCMESFGAAIAGLSENFPVRRGSLLMIS